MVRLHDRRRLHNYTHGRQPGRAHGTIHLWFIRRSLVSADIEFDKLEGSP